MNVSIGGIAVRIARPPNSAPFGFVWRVDQFGELANGRPLSMLASFPASARRLAAGRSGEGGKGRGVVSPPNLAN